MAWGARSNLDMVVGYALMLFMVHSLSLQWDTFAFFFFCYCNVYFKYCLLFRHRFKGGEKPRFKGLKA